MPRVTLVKKAQKPNPVVTQEDIDKANNGEVGAASYYWWKFKNSGKRFSKTRPRSSQLTQSEFLSQAYEIGEEIEDCDFDSMDDAQMLIEDWSSRIRELGSECEEKQQNMPDSLQYSDTGQLLENRAQECESWADELENVDLDPLDLDEDQIKQKAQDEYEEQKDGDEPEWEDLDAEQKESFVADAKDEMFEEAKQEVMDNIMGCEYNGE